MIHENMTSKHVTFPDSKNLNPIEFSWCHDISFQSSPQSKISLELQPWEIRKGKEEFLQWRMKQRCHTLFFDGASKGNPKEEGVGGIIFDPGGNIVNSFSWGIGHKSNNEAECLLLFLLLELVGRNTISKLILFGDSKEVI